MPVALLGFLRLYVAPDAPAGSVLTVDNPHVARSVLAVDGQKLGEVAPLARVVVRGLPDGLHTVSWTTPTGFTRETEVATTPPPAR